ncbi:MAG: O-acetyl-ADP-ribose deacetylase [Bacteroidota bacterium]
MKHILRVIVGDITHMMTDAIVNAANTDLLGGGGVDGAIHEAAGPQLLDACRKLNGCNVGEAKITKAFELPCRFVIHTVGPVWKGGKHNEEQLLYDAYHNSLLLAYQYHLHSISFPNISTGVYHFPKERAANIAISACNNFLIQHFSMEEIVFVCFEKSNFDIYQKILHPELIASKKK